MTDKQAIMSTVCSNIVYCNTLYDIRDELKCINLCNSCIYKKIPKPKTNFEYPCFIYRVTDKLLELIPQLDLCNNLTVIKDNEIKNFAFKIESYLAYDNDNDKFTKKEILELVKEILKEEYKIEDIKE